MARRLSVWGDWGDTIGDLNIETGKMNLKTFRERPKVGVYSESYALTHDKLAIGGVSGKIQLWDTISDKKLPTLRRQKSFEMGKKRPYLRISILS